MQVGSIIARFFFDFYFQNPLTYENYFNFSPYILYFDSLYLYYFGGVYNT